MYQGSEIPLIQEILTRRKGAGNCVDQCKHFPEDKVHVVPLYEVARELIEDFRTRLLFLLSPLDGSAFRDKY